MDSAKECRTTLPLITDMINMDEMMAYGGLKKTVDTLEELINELHKVFSYDNIDVDYVSQLLLSYKSNQSEWKKYAKFDRYRYTRNLVDEGNGKFNLMILCWGEGQASAIHDHANAHCFMKMLKGELEEVRYVWPEAHDPNPTQKFIENGNADNRSPCNEDRQVATDKCNGSNIIYSAPTNTPHTGTHNNESIEENEYGHEMVELGRTTLETNGVCYINDSLGLHRVLNPSHADSAVSLHLYCPPFDACHVFNQQTGHKTKCNVTFWSKFGQKRNREIQDSQAPEDN